MASGSGPLTKMCSAAATPFLTLNRGDLLLDKLLEEQVHAELVVDPDALGDRLVQRAIDRDDRDIVGNVGDRRHGCRAIRGDDEDAVDPVITEHAQPPHLLVDESVRIGEQQYRQDAARVQ